MVTRDQIDDFLAQDAFALAGASHKGGHFGNTVIRELRAKGYALHPVHPRAEEIEGLPAVRRLADLPEGIGGLILSVPPEASERLVEEAADAGIPRVWMLHGASSPAARERGLGRGLTVIDRECILMFAEPAGFIHRAHRFFSRVFGQLPQ